jgi:hypothetical protein
MLMLLLLAGACSSSAADDLGYLLRGVDVPVSEAPIVSPGESAPSPGLSFLLSALVPGAGQVYQGRPIGWAFVAADAALWGGYAALKADGHDLEDGYRAFADDHFDLTNPDFSNDAERGWYEWWDFFRTIEPTFVWGDTLYWHDIREARDIDRARYYQDIEASNAYIFGWNDWAPNEFGNADFWWQDADGLHVAYVSPHRDEYRRMRAKADSRLRWASRLVGVALAARVATAIEALHNAREQRADVADAAQSPRGMSVSIDWARSDPALVVAWRCSLK